LPQIDEDTHRFTEAKEDSLEVSKRLLALITHHPSRIYEEE